MPSGGRRPGAGRPKGQGRYGEPTHPVRVPLSLVEPVQQYLESKGYQLPLYSSKVQAGFPSPAEDHIESRIDLNTHLIARPAATFLLKAAGDSMIGAGIHEDDLLIVDRSINAKHGQVVIAAVDGELTVKRLHQSGGVTKLLAENDAYSDITFSEGQELHIWGVVTNVIHAL